jgi:hypothetical protein
MKFFLKLVGINSTTLDNLLAHDTDSNHDWLRMLAKMESADIFQMLKKNAGIDDLQHQLEIYLAPLWGPSELQGAMESVFKEMVAKMIPGVGMIEAFITALDWVTKNKQQLMQVFANFADVLRTITDCNPDTVASRLMAFLKSSAFVAISLFAQQFGLQKLRMKLLDSLNYIREYVTTKLLAYLGGGPAYSDTVESKLPSGQVVTLKVSVDKKLNVTTLVTWNPTYVAADALKKLQASQACQTNRRPFADAAEKVKTFQNKIKNTPIIKNGVADSVVANNLGNYCQGKLAFHHIVDGHDGKDLANTFAILVQNASAGCDPCQNLGKEMSVPVTGSGGSFTAKVQVGVDEQGKALTYCSAGIITKGNGCNDPVVCRVNSISGTVKGLLQGGPLTTPRAGWPQSLMNKALLTNQPNPNVNTTNYNAGHLIGLQ